MNVVDVVQKLIALSASGDVEEARSAAHTACRLIREHKLVVAEQSKFGFQLSPDTDKPKKTSKPPKGTPETDPLGDLVDEYLRKAHATTTEAVMGFATKHMGFCIGCGDDVDGGPFISDLGLLYHAGCYPWRDK